MQTIVEYLNDIIFKNSNDKYPFLFADDFVCMCSTTELTDFEFNCIKSIVSTGAFENMKKDDGRYYINFNSCNRFIEIF